MKSVHRDEIVNYLDLYLGVDKIKDDLPHGLQVEGKTQVSKVVVSVSASEELFVRAAQAEAQMVIVHHGLFWKSTSPVIRGSHKKRIQTLLQNELSLLGYHLPLDAHPEIGNNVL